MAQASIPLPYLNWDYKNQKVAYNEWKDFMESYFVIQGVDESKKWHYILLSAGPKGRELWEAWKLSSAEKSDSSKVFKKFKDHLVGTPNKWVARVELAALNQRDNESIDEFVCRLRAKCSECMFTNDSDEHLTFQLIRGLKSVDIRRKLIAKGNDLKIDVALKCAIEHEATVHNTESFSQPTHRVDAMKASKPPKNCCRFCGSSHPPRKCPAYGKECKSCHSMNHFAKMCLKKQHHRKPSHSRQKHKQSVNTLDARDDVTDAILDCGTLCVDAMERSQRSRQSIMAKLEIKPPGVRQKATLRVKADTGANGSILPTRCLLQMYPNEEDRRAVIQPSSATLTAVNGTTMKQHGTLKMPVRFDDSAWIDCQFFICDTDGPAILSCDVTEKVGIVKVSNSRHIATVTQQKLPTDVPIPDRSTLQSLYPDRFEGIGNLPGNYAIELKPNAEPVVAPPRKYPIQLKEEICKKLSEMQQMGVITKCDDDESSEWVNQLAFSRKANGDLRICLDPKHLNAAMKRTHYKTPTIDEISHKLAGSTIFSKLDAKNGYWGIHLTEESSKMCTFQSPAGKYRFLRLPFGLKVSQDVFQSKMDRILDEAGEGCIGIADDVIVFGKSTTDHDASLHRLMMAARKNGLVLNLDKCDIRQSSVTFFGLIWSNEGMKPDPKKCDNIKKKESPRSVQELQSFLGLIQYMSPFIPHLATKTSLLRQLLKKECPWEWTAEHEKAFVELKSAINKDLLLQYFDPSRPVTIEVDASLKGLGAALIQEGRPIAFASKSLLPAETRYANIERELLAVVFGLEHFHCFVYGKPVLIHSDHRPLEAIHQKQLSKVPPRLQRMLLRIQPYDATIQYKPGKELLFADYLSRTTPTQGPEIELERTIHTIQVSTKQLERVREETSADDQLGILKEQVIRGWPDSVEGVPRTIRSYWSTRDRISVEDGVLFLGERMIVPLAMQQEYLDRIHAGHLGVTKSQLRAKECIYWPKMMTDIE